MLVAVPPILTFYLNIVHFPTQYVWPSKINARAKVWSPKTWGSKKSKFFGGGSLFNMNSYNIPPIYYTSSIKKYEYSKNPKTKILDVNLVPWLAARMTPSFPSRNRFPPAMSRVKPCICIYLLHFYWFDRWQCPKSLCIDQHVVIVFVNAKITLSSPCRQSRPHYRKTGPWSPHRSLSFQWGTWLTNHTQTWMKYFR